MKTEHPVAFGRCQRPGHGTRSTLVAVLVAATVFVSGGCDLLTNHAPVAVLVARETFGEAPLEVAFDASQSYDPDGDELSYEWHFGDGKTAVESTVLHVFAAPGNYSVEVQVGDPRGLRSTASILVTAALETVEDTLGQAGGRLVTSEGSSVTVPAGSLDEGTAVAISELSESPFVLKSGVSGVGASVVVSLTLPPIQRARGPGADAAGGLLGIEVPLSEGNAQMLDAGVCGFVLELFSGSGSARIATAADIEGTTARTWIPIELLRDLAAGVQAPTLAAHALVDSNNLDCGVRATPVSVSVEHVPTGLYLSDSQVKLTLLEDGAIADSATIPIILVHGYQILGADELVAGKSTGTSREVGTKAYNAAEDRIRDHWGDFIRWFHTKGQSGSSPQQTLNQLVPGRAFKIYGFRWETDEGIEEAAKDLGEEITQHFASPRHVLLIGHSAGGLVVRATAQGDPAVGDTLLGMITLASPHLGVPVAHLAFRPLFDTTLTDLSPDSAVIKKLNASAAQNRKLAAYGGWIDWDDFQWSCTYFFHYASPLFGDAANDGIVGLDSAVLLGDSPPSIRSRKILDHYDHFDMLHDRRNGLVFSGVLADLVAFVKEGSDSMNTAPIAVAGTDITAAWGSLVTLDGSGSYDADVGAPLTYRWSQVEGPGSVTLVAGSTASAASFTPTIVGVYKFSLVVSDGKLDSAPAYVTVTVAGKADLTVPRVSCPTSARVGDTVRCSFAARNQGESSPGQFSYSIYLSTSEWGTSTLLREVSWPGVAPLEPGTTYEPEEEVVIPGIPDGDYYMTVFIDSRQQVDESSEENNIGSTHPARIKISSLDATVTLTLYVHANNESGPPLSGAVVSGYDGVGNSFSQTTNASGYVTLTGQPGTWHFSAAKLGYQTNTWDQSTTTNVTRHAYLTPNAPTLSLTGLSPSTITTSSSTYQATLQLTGSNFLNVSRVSYSWSGPDNGSTTWNQGDPNWNSAVTIGSGSSMTLNPVVLSNETSSQSKTWTWIVALQDNTGATAARSFTVTYNPPAPAPVTLTLYVHDGSASGPVLPGVSLTGWDGVGAAFSQTTNTSGYVTLTGQPGTWHFSASKSGYQTNTWDQSTTTNVTRHAYIWR